MLDTCAHFLHSNVDLGGLKDIGENIGPAERCGGRTVYGLLP